MPLWRVRCYLNGYDPGEREERAMSPLFHGSAASGPVSDEAPVRPPLDLMQPAEVATATFALG